MTDSAALERTAASTSNPPNSFDISQLDVRRFDIFSVVSDRYWARAPLFVRSFVAHAKEVETPAFLVARSASVCRAAVTELAVSCVVSRHYDRDDALSKERWRILLHCVQLRHRMMYVGMDVRFLRPARSFFDAVPTEADAAFEGALDSRKSRVIHFTPDLAAAFPTSRSEAFLRRLVKLIDDGPTLDGLPVYMRDKSLLRSNLLGPAEQDLLFDALLSTIYGRLVVARKYALALAAANRQCTLGRACRSPAHNASLPQCVGTSGVAASSCADTGVLEELELGTLNTSQDRAGTLVRSPRLRVFMTDGRSVLTGSHFCLTATRCRWALSSTPPLAIHCAGKEPECLNMTQCVCQQWRARQSATASSTVHLM